MDPASPTDERAGNKASFRKTCWHLWIITKAFFTSGRRHRARRFIIALLALALSVGGVQVLMSYVARDFMTAIAKKDAAAYWQSLWWYLGTFALAIPLGVYYRWTEERLAVLWREWMAGAFSLVLAAVSLIITQFERLSAYLAGVQRLGLLWNELDEFDAEEAIVAQAGSQDVDDDSSACINYSGNQALVSSASDTAAL